MANATVSGDTDTIETVSDNEPQEIQEAQVPSVAAALATPPIKQKSISKDDILKEFASELGFESAGDLTSNLQKLRESDEAKAEAEKSALEKLKSLEERMSEQEAKLAAKDEQIRLLHEDQFIMDLASPKQYNFNNPRDAVLLVDRSSFSNDSNEDYLKSVENAVKKLAKSKKYLVNSIAPVPDAGKGASEKKIKSNNRHHGDDLAHLMPTGFVMPQ
jgi:hypothetical protein